MEKRDSNVTFLRDITITNDWFSSGFHPKLCSKDAILECPNDLPLRLSLHVITNANSVSGMAHLRSNSSQMLTSNF